jgi:hypothetical protein
LPDFPRLALELVGLGTWTAWMFLRHGLSASLRAEAARRAPDWIKPFLLRMGFLKSET